MEYADLLQLLQGTGNPNAPADLRPDPAQARPRLADQFPPQAPTVPVAAPATPTPTPTPTPPRPVMPPTRSAAPPQDSGILSKILPYALPVLAGVASAASPVAARGVGAAANMYLAGQQQTALNQRQRLQDMKFQELQDYHRATLAGKGGPKYHSIGGELVKEPGAGETAATSVFKAPMKLKDLMSPEMRDALVGTDVPLDSTWEKLRPEQRQIVESARLRLREDKASATEAGKLKQVINFGGYAPGGKPAAGKGDKPMGYLDENGNFVPVEAPAGAKVVAPPKGGDKPRTEQQLQSAAHSFATQGMLTTENMRLKGDARTKKFNELKQAQYKVEKQANDILKKGPNAGGPPAVEDPLGIR